MAQSIIDFIDKDVLEKHNFANRNGDFKSKNLMVMGKSTSILVQYEGDVYNSIFLYHTGKHSSVLHTIVERDAWIASVYHKEIKAFLGKDDSYNIGETFFIKVGDKVRKISERNPEVIVELTMLYDYALTELNKMEKSEALKSSFYTLKKDIEAYINGKTFVVPVATAYMTQEQYNNLVQETQIEAELQYLITKNVLPKEGLLRKYPRNIEELKEVLPKVSKKYNDYKLDKAKKQEDLKERKKQKELKKQEEQQKKIDKQKKIEEAKNSIDDIYGNNL